MTAHTHTHTHTQYRKGTPVFQKLCNRPLNAMIINELRVTSQFLKLCNLTNSFIFCIFK